MQIYLVMLMNLLQQKRVLTKESSLTSQLSLRLQHGDRFVVLNHLYGCGGFIWIIIRWIIHYSLWILLDGMLRVRQDESNPALWLATWAVKMALSCPLGITPCALQQNIVFLRIIIIHYWLGLFCLFLRVYGLELRLGPKIRKRKRSWPISSHVHLTLCQ